MKKLLLTLVKIGISVGIVAYLIHDAVGTETAEGENIFRQLIDQPKDWGMLAMACLFCGAAVTTTLIRWWYLVRALEVSLTFRDALRIGYLGYLFNLAPMGVVGGDFLKGWMLDREHPGNRAKAIASVVVDRMNGLFLLFIVATTAIFLTGLWSLPDENIHWVCILTLLATGSGAVVIGVVLTPGFTDGRGTRALARLPKIGPAIESIIDAVRMYRKNPVALIVASLMSVAVHSLFATGIYCIARGLPGDVHSYWAHFVISPLSASAGVIPLPMGPFEAVLEYLYLYVPEPGVQIAVGQGLVVALGYRLITLLIATIGICYYLASRAEVAQALHEAEE